MTAEHPDNDVFIKQLYLAHRAELCRYLVHKSRLNTAEAEDITQSAFAKFSALEQPQAIENPRAFLYKMATNLAIDFQRRNQVQDKYVLFSAADESSVPGPERVTEGKQRLGILSRALWGMPKRRRQLLMMSRFDGLSYAEIGRQLGLSESVVRKHVNNALADCHKALFARDNAGQTLKELVKQGRT
ncbi:RNA polymerase sigma factor [Simiduia litorea]|uniref:RNA polymerase sigma factor n=1 Tax=Simiduia litorea TaxID=1435348 RepID=UPI0036F32027